MRVLPVLIAVALPLTACSVEKTAKVEGDKTANFSALENGAVSFEVPGMKGHIKLPAAMMTSSDMDIDGVKLFPGSHVSNVRAEEKVVTINFSSPTKVDALKDYYGKEFRKAGTQATIQGNGFGGKTKDGDDFSLGFTEAGTATNGTLVIRDKD